MYRSFGNLVLLPIIVLFSVFNLGWYITLPLLVFYFWCFHKFLNQD